MRRRPDARYTYRRFGKTSGPPVVTCTRFRGTIDYRDRALLDLLAAAPEVIIFDNVGAASSTGITPTTVRGVGDGTVRFIEAPGLAEVDGLGWSMGGYGDRIV